MLGNHVKYLDQLSEFVDDHIKNMAVNIRDSIVKESNKKFVSAFGKSEITKKSNYNDKIRVENNSNDGLDKKNVCFYCNSGEHLSLYDCDDFKALNLSDRIKFAYEKHLCYKCLKRGHIARDCCQTNVKVCRGGYHGELVCLCHAKR